MHLTVPGYTVICNGYFVVRGTFCLAYAMMSMSLVLKSSHLFPGKEPRAVLKHLIAHLLRVGNNFNHSINEVGKFAAGETVEELRAFVVLVCISPRFISHNPYGGSQHIVSHLWLQLQGIGCLLLTSVSTEYLCAHPYIQTNTLPYKIK